MATSRPQSRKRPSTESLARAAPAGAPVRVPRRAARAAEAAPRPPGRVREKLVAALRRLHPMD